MTLTSGTSRLACAAILVLTLRPGVLAAPQEPKTIVRESTVTATVDRIERSSRVVTVRGDANTFLSVYVDPTVKEFDELQVGDRVTVRYVDSAIVKVRPGAKPSEVRDTTEEARKAGLEHVVSQVQAVVTIERVDRDGFVTYRTHDNMLATRAVVDKRILDELHQGDTVEITLTRERAVSIERARR